MPRASDELKRLARQRRRHGRNAMRVVDIWANRIAQSLRLLNNSNPTTTLAARSLNLPSNVLASTEPTSTQQTDHDRAAITAIAKRFTALTIPAQPTDTLSPTAALETLFEELQPQYHDIVRALARTFFAYPNVCDRFPPADAPIRAPHLFAITDHAITS